jgi:hypothetical protein
MTATPDQLRLQQMHRRAQAAEGKLARQTRVLGLAAEQIRSDHQTSFLGIYLPMMIRWALKEGSRKRRKDWNRG